MRSVLTSLGVVIGVAAVVMMTSIGLGAQQRVTSADLRPGLEPDHRDARTSSAGRLVPGAPAAASR